LRARHSFPTRRSSDLNLRSLSDLKIPRIVIGGTHSGVGKTSIAIGIMGALARKGRRVQGFKIGPDFLDTSFHTAVTGRPSRNLEDRKSTRLNSSHDQI